MVPGAGSFRIGLSHGAFADWFKDEVTVLFRHVHWVDQSHVWGVEVQEDVVVAVGFLTDNGDGSGDGDTRVDDV